MGVHWGLPLCVTALFCAASYVQVRLFAVNDYDYGIYLNLLWNIANGHGWDTSLYRDLLGFSMLGDHFVPGAAVFAPLARLWESPYVLSQLHGVMFGATFFLLPHLVRAIWEHEQADPDDPQGYLAPALFFSLMLFFMRPFLMAWRYQSHMGSLVAPLVLVAVLALYRDKRGWFWAAIVMMLFAQERASLFVCGVGIYATLVLRRYRLGGFLVVFSSLWFLAVVKVVIPWFQGGARSYLYAQTIAPLYGLGDKVRYTGTLIWYNFLLPLCGRRAMLAALAGLPLLSLNLVSRRETMYSFTHHYSDALALFLLLASIHGFIWLRDLARAKGLAPRWLVGGCVVVLCAAFIHTKWVTPPGLAWRLLQKDNVAMLNALHADLAPFAAVDDDIEVFTHLGLGPRFSLRSQRRVITPERAAMPLRNALVVASPVVGQWTTDYAGITRNLEANPTMIPVVRTPHLCVYASEDVIPRLSAAGRATHRE